MGFTCAPPCVWPSPGSRGASYRGAIAAARGRIAGRGLQGERRRRRQPSPTGGLGLGNCLRLHGEPTGKTSCSVELCPPGKLGEVKLEVFPP
eukprot:bmy_18080T0